MFMFDCSLILYVFIKVCFQVYRILIISLLIIRVWKRNKGFNSYIYSHCHNKQTYRKRHVFLWLKFRDFLVKVMRDSHRNVEPKWSVTIKSRKSVCSRKAFVIYALSLTLLLLYIFMWLRQGISFFWVCLICKLNKISYSL